MFGPLGAEPLETGNLPLELLPDLEDELGERGIVDITFRGAQAVGGHARKVAGERRESPLLGVRRDPRKLEQLQRDTRIERRLLDLDAACSGCIHPFRSEAFEELIHAVTYSTVTAEGIYALGVDNQIVEMVRRLGACPACGTRWSVVEESDGNIRIQGSRPAYAHEMRYDVPGAVRICSECGNGVNTNGGVVRRRE